jgi:hypothetical protein
MITPPHTADDSTRARGRFTAFNLDALPGLVRRGHAADVKLYLTLNTLALVGLSLPRVSR